MKKLPLLLAGLFLAGCAGTKLTVVNTTGKPIKNVEIKLAEKSLTLPQMAEGEAHSQSVKVEAPLSVNVHYQDAEGRQHYTSSPVQLKPGEGGSLKLSITAKGTLEAVRTK